MVVQGNFITDIEDFLKHEIKIPESQIVTINKLDKKKEKRFEM